jgi:hypothetical protein
MTIADGEMPVGRLMLKQWPPCTEHQLEIAYDIALFPVSWEPRTCAVLSSISNLSSEVYFLLFDSVNAEAELRKKTMVQKMSEICSFGNLLELRRSTNFRANLKIFTQFLREKVDKTRRPIRVLLDMTCIPKSYMLFLLAWGFESGVVSRLDFFYSEGDYSITDLPDEHTLSAIGREIVSEGAWESIQIPYLSSENVMPNRRDVFASLGGEVGLSVPFIEKYEPSRLGLGFISEGIIKDPSKLIHSEKVALESILKEPNISQYDFALLDVLGVVQTVQSFCRDSKADAVTGLALGSKTHALALGIAGLGTRNLDIICRIPQNYRQIEVMPTGIVSRYTLWDRFEPEAYA